MGRFAPILAHFGPKIPVSHQFPFKNEVKRWEDPEDCEPGDLIFYELDGEPNGRLCHVEIFLGGTESVGSMPWPGPKRSIISLDFPSLSLIFGGFSMIFNAFYGFPSPKVFEKLMYLPCFGGVSMRNAHSRTREIDGVQVFEDFRIPKENGKEYRGPVAPVVAFDRFSFILFHMFSYNFGLFYMKNGAKPVEIA